MKNFFISVLGLIVLTILSWLFTYSDRTKANRVAEQYPIIKQSDYFQGVVTKTINMKDSLYNKGLTYVDLNNGKHFSLMAFTENKSYSISKLNEFLQAGDSIYKKANNDTIYLYRSDKEYYFVIHK